MYIYYIHKTYSIPTANSTTGDTKMATGDRTDYRPLRQHTHAADNIVRQPATATSPFHQTMSPMDARRLIRVTNDEDEDNIGGSGECVGFYLYLCQEHTCRSLCHDNLSACDVDRNVDTHK